jgi:peptidyl-prolyl cis-trans isomerase D
MAGVINKIRQRAGLVIILIGISLAAFIFTDLLRSIPMFGGPDNTVAQVWGKKLDYTDFMNKVQAQAQLQAPLMDNMGEAQMEQIRQSIWGNVMDSLLFGKLYDRYNLHVTDFELAQMLTGDFINPLIRQVFGQGRPDATDDQIRALVRQNIEALNNPQVEPEQIAGLRAYLTLVENDLLFQRRSEKLQTLIKSGVFVSPSDVTQYLSESQTSASFRFVALPFANIADDQVPAITESELKDYYKANRAQYRVKHTETILKYIKFPIRPSSADSLRVFEELEEARDQFAKLTNPSDDSAYAAARSDLVEFTFDLQTATELDPISRERYLNAEQGTIFGPELGMNKVTLTKLTDNRQDTVPHYQLRHIFIQIKGNTNADTLEAQSLAARLADQARRKDTAFAELVMRYSDDNQSKMASGDIGWYKFGRFGPSFDKAIQRLAAKPGDVRGPILSEAGGFHVIEVVNTDSRVVRFATITKTFSASQRTIDSLRAKAGKFVARIDNLDDFIAEADSQRYAITTTQPISFDRQAVTGEEDRTAILQWALDSDRSVGDVSDVITTKTNVIVAVISSRSESGYRNFESVRDEVQKKVLNQKKAAFITEKLKNVSAGSLDAYLGAGVPGGYISQANNIPFTSNTFSNANEPYVLGKVFTLKPQELSKPIVGNNAVYIVQLTELVKPEAPQEEQLSFFKRQLQNQRENEYWNLMRQAIEQEAEVRDLRYKFNL